MTRTIVVVTSSLSTDYPERIVVEHRPAHLDLTLREFRFGGNDPTCLWTEGRFVRAMLTPEGPGTVEIAATSIETVTLHAHGQGGGWILDHRHDILGLADEIPVLTSFHPAVERAARRWGSVRIARSLCPYQELLPAVLGQRITALEATRQWRDLVRSFGEPAPGNFGLLCPPEPSRVAGIPYYDLHHIGIERSRAQRLVNVARSFLAQDHNPTSEYSTPAIATAGLSSIRGVGPWTAAVAGALAFGDADALRVGDFHIKNLVAWALRGVPRGTDAEMLDTLEPYMGNRHRVVHWLQLDGWNAPQMGPRRPIVSIRDL